MNMYTKEYITKNIEALVEIEPSGVKDLLRIIDKIYEEVDSRTCRNCVRHACPSDVAPDLYCKNGVTESSMTRINKVSADFGCNKFKRIEE